MSIQYLKEERESVAFTTIFFSHLPLISIWDLNIMSHYYFFQAKRAGMKCVLIPEENRSKFEDLDEAVKSDLEVHFVKHYKEVFDIVFPKEEAQSW